MGTKNCNGRCRIFFPKVKRTKYPYADGLKQCNVCKWWYKIDSFLCPCCNEKLRTRPFKGSSHRRSKYKEQVEKNKQLVKDLIPI